jgi:sulfur carrier protein
LTIQVFVNGDARSFPEGACVADVVADMVADVVADVVAGRPVSGDGLPARAGGIAVALDQDVVPAGRWALTPLGDGDRLEILGAVAGG